MSSVFVSALLAAAMMLSACGSDDAATATAGEGGSTAPGDTAATSPGATSDVILASTTSTQDSGLFDVLLAAFEAAYPQYTVKAIAVGTGEALQLGVQKDADVLLVHAPASEKEFVANGFGTERLEVMYNDFVIVGPADDPAGVKSAGDAAEALGMIAAAESRFVSRGDDSGTHRKELGLWASAGVEPAGDWYEAVGQGMGEVLRIASERLAYTLTDRATYLNLKANLELEIVLEGDSALFNQYGVIPVTDATNLQGANDFAAWITSPDGQAVIETYGVEEFGQPLFVPNAK